MNDIEKKLAEYRAKKLNNSQQSKLNYKQNLLHFIAEEQSSETRVNLQHFIYLYYIFMLQELQEKLINEPHEENENLSSSETCTEVDDTLNCCSYMDIVYYTFCFMLWATIWAIFIKLQFGTVYLIISGLIGIYLNTRTRPKKKGEVSAYSVFNKNCESIDGTLKAEQFEREIRYGPAMVHQKFTIIRNQVDISARQIEAF